MTVPGIHGEVTTLLFSLLFAGIVALVHHDPHEVDS
jgi:hypothetical protein